MLKEIESMHRTKNSVKCKYCLKTIEVYCLTIITSSANITRNYDGIYGIYRRPFIEMNLKIIKLFILLVNRNAEKST